MVTKYPRMQITLPPEVKTIYSDAAQAMGIPTSRLITQTLIKAVPNIREISGFFTGFDARQVAPEKPSNLFVETEQLSEAECTERANASLLRRKAVEASAKRRSKKGSKSRKKSRR